MKTFELIKPQAIEVVVHGDNQLDFEEFLDGLQVYSSDTKRIYSVLLDNPIIAELKQKVLNPDVYVSLSYTQPEQLESVSVVDEKGDAFSPYVLTKQDVQVRKWVKKRMFITLAQGNRVYIAGWRLSFSEPDLCENLIYLSYKIGEVNCSLRCYLPSLMHV